MILIRLFPLPRRKCSTSAACMNELMVLGREVMIHWISSISRTQKPLRESIISSTSLKNEGDDMRKGKGKHYTIKYNFSESMTSRKSFDGAIDTIFMDYLIRIHHIRMAMLGLPRNTRNWEQIEARQVDLSFSETIKDKPSDSILRRVILTAGKEKNRMRIIDLVLL